jgi:hypothetical protein
MKRLLLCVALLISLASTGLGQRIGKPDMKIGCLILGEPFESVSAKLGRPDSVRTLDQEWRGFMAYYYPRLIVWTENQDKRICAIDIYDTSFVTARGLRLGDSTKKINTLYPTRGPERKKFSRVGPYDYTFKDYTSVTILENSIQEEEGWFMVMFTKNDRLVKMLYYIGVNE